MTDKTKLEPKFIPAHSGQGVKSPHEFVSGPIECGVAGMNFYPVAGRDILAADLPERVWLWELWIPAGSLVLLSALPKAGKTTFVYRLTMALVRGLPFLGYKTKKTPVLMLAVEENQYDVYTRFLKLGLTHDDDLFVHTGFLQMKDSEMERIEKFVRDNQVGVIIVDTLSHFWPVQDENDNAEVSRHMRKLLELRDKTNATILLIHHQRKNDNGGIASGTAIRGAGALLASVDQAITLQRTPGQKNRRTLSGIGRYADTPDELVIELKDGVYSALGTGQDAADVDNFKRLTLVMNSQPKDTAQLAAATGLAERYIRKLLDKWGHCFAVTGKGVKGDPLRWAVRPACGVPD